MGNAMTCKSCDRHKRYLLSLLVAKIVKSLREEGRENPELYAKIPPPSPLSRHGHRTPAKKPIHKISLRRLNEALLHYFVSLFNPIPITAMIALTYLEFYSGIGGWGYALEHALRNVAPSSPEPKLLGAYDHSDLCKNVFNQNHHNKKLFRQTPIERITREQLEMHSAHIWCMSPVSGHTYSKFPMTSLS